MKVLITGGTGTISSGLVKECVNRGYEVYAVTRGTNKCRNIPGAEYIYCDIWSLEFKEIMKEKYYDVIVDCQTYNLDQLEKMLSIFSDKCNQYVFISTAGVYNRISNRRIKESDEKNYTEWSYTRDKIQCEKALIKYAETAAFSYTIIRPTVTYGDYRIPFPIATRCPGWTLFQRILDEKPILSSKNVLFSIIHIDDFSRAVVSLFGNKLAMNEDFHISSNDNDLYWDDVIKLAGEVLGKKPLIIHVPEDDYRIIYPLVYQELKYNKNDSLVLDDKKIREVSGTKANIDNITGIKQIIYNMKSEYLKEKKLDFEWNEQCDATIYYAYKKYHLNEDENRLLKEYFDQVDETIYKKSINKVRVKNFKRKMRLCLSRIKSLFR